MADIITVAALNRYVKSILESDPVLTDVAIRGEISNFTKHYKTGHCYFTLKDDNASVKAVMFRSYAQELIFQPENGMSVVVRCRISLFERDGTFQLYVEDMFPDGVGAAQMAFEQLKNRLDNEGLFAPEAKRTIPAYPHTIGLVTSKTGAALQDILNVASRRCPSAHFLLAPVSVQGSAAAEGIAHAITALDTTHRADLIIVARGGGSMEDLWVFNSEKIARAAFACTTPIISAIGHEIDYTILDFVSDLRAPTPSAAAELALPDIHKTLADMTRIHKNITNMMHIKQETWYNYLQSCIANPSLKQINNLPILLHEHLVEAGQAICGAQAKHLQAKQRQLAGNARLTASLNPYATLARGYAAIKQGEKYISSIQNIQKNDTLEIHMHDGTVDCVVQHVSSNEVQ